MARRVFVLGLDSAPPRIVYERDGVDLGVIGEIVDESLRFDMRSSYPPITVPAWMVMFTGKTPGELGIYGFRHRRPGEFGTYIVNSRHVRYPTLWEDLGRRRLRVGVFGVPPTYPPKPVHGWLVTDFTTPGPEKPYTFPPWLKREIEARFGPMIFDIVYRSHDKDAVARELLHMTQQHLRVVEHLAASRKWDFMVYMEIGVDRVHHAFWRYYDKNHPRYEWHERYSRVIPEFYQLLARGFERIREKIPPDAIIVVVSDHGAKAMKGAFALNQWLIERGYLALKKEPSRPGIDLEPEMVDWGKTLAWAWGGYYSRVFINLKGREPQGTVEPRDYEDVVEQLRGELLSIKGPNGEAWRNIVHRPHEVYPQVNGDAPDLMVYLDNLDWRPAGTLGWPSPYLEENDRGPDDMVHDWTGVLAIYDPEGTLEKGHRGTIGITEIRPLLEELVRGRS